MIIHDLLLFLDARGIHTPDKISVRDNDEFIKSFYGLSPKGIETKLCTLRRYYRHLYLQGYIRVLWRSAFLKRPYREGWLSLLYGGRMR
ncbi:MAG: hypothetical protein ACLR0U_21910 [Enterocloster clostridioformis]